MIDKQYLRGDECGECPCCYIKAFFRKNFPCPMVPIILIVLVIVGLIGAIASACSCNDKKIKYYPHDQKFYVPADQIDKFNEIFGKDSKISKVPQYEEAHVHKGEDCYQGLREHGYVVEIKPELLQQFGATIAATSGEIAVIK